MNWKPKEGERYFFVEIGNGIWSVEDTTFGNDFVDKDSILIGNCFRTEAQAQTALKRIKNVLKGVKR